MKFGKQLYCFWPFLFHVTAVLAGNWCSGPLQTYPPSELTCPIGTLVEKRWVWLWKCLQVFHLKSESSLKSLSLRVWVKSEVDSGVFCHESHRVESQVISCLTEVKRKRNLILPFTKLHDNIYDLSMIFFVCNKGPNMQGIMCTLSKMTFIFKKLLASQQKFSGE